jgi:enoyl-CoA hydratase/carnithine racemase
VRAILLTGSQKAFAAGADIKEMAPLTFSEAYTTSFIESWSALTTNVKKPIIAAVSGHALGGGCELALSCDLVVADQTAVFGLPETTVGLVPGSGGTQLALRRLGPGRAADLILTGRRIDADEAYRIGLADRLVPAGTARKEAVSLAGLIARNSPVAVRAAKQAIRNGAGTGLAAGLDIEDAAWRTAAFSADRKEGIAAFNEKRAPQWPGE